MGTIINLKNIQNLRLFLVCFFIGITSILGATPLNDDPCGAEVLTVSTSCSFSNSYTNVASTTTVGPSFPSYSCGNNLSDPAGGSGLNPLWGNPIQNDVWFKFVVPSNGMVTIDTKSGTLIDAVMSIYRGSLCSGTLTNIKCNDLTASGSALNQMPIIAQSGLIAGETIWIRIGVLDGSFGTFSVCVTSPSGLPANTGNPAATDDCSASQQVCNLDGYYGQTLSSYSATVWKGLTDKLATIPMYLQND